jgi:hypothetical protein
VVLDDPRRLATDTTMAQSYGFSRQQSLFGDWLGEFEAPEGRPQKCHGLETLDIDIAPMA